jgi:ABC-type Fe3+ transport system substrate-binding protein
MAQPFGVVDILVSGEPTEHGPPQHPHERVTAVLAGAAVGQPFARHRAEAKRIVEFAIGEQTGVRRDDRTAKLQRQPAVEIKPQGIAVRFTRRVRHDVSFQISLRY